MLGVMPDNTNVVLIGHVCIDHNDNESITYTSWGSPLMYIAEYCQMYLKNKPILIAPYGHDFDPYAKDVNLLIEAQEESTLVYKNHTINGKRIQSCEHAKYSSPVKLTPLINRAVAEADIIALTPLLPNYTTKYVRNLLANRKSNCLSVLLPQGYFRHVNADGSIAPRKFEEAAEIISLFDMVIFSDEDTSEPFKKAKQWARHTPGNIIVTQGESGASVITSSGVTQVTTQAVPLDEIVDSVGCGDIFSMAAMSSFYQDRDIIKAVRAGNETARARLFQPNLAKNL